MHGDAYITNFLEGGTAIDMERACMGSPMLDVTNLVQDPKAFTVSRDRLLEKYNQEVVQYGGTVPDESDVLRSYVLHTIFNSICNVGSKVSQDNDERAGAYAKQASKVMASSGMHDLQRLFEEYILASDHTELEPYLLGE